MAFLDDSKWVLNYLRTQFVTSDDSGVCEAVMGNDCDPVSDEQDRPNGPRRRETSPDIYPNMDDKSRRRSNTALRLEKVKKEREQKSRIKVSKWNKTTAEILPSEDDEATNSPIKQVHDIASSKVDEKPKASRSVLSQQLEHTRDSAPSNENAFIAFAKFDGRLQHGNVRSLRIFVYRLGNSANQTLLGSSVSVNLCINPDIKVSDLIGLACWWYTSENRQPSLKPSTDFYSLYVAEDGGEVDSDLPPIDVSENINRFVGIDNFALLESEEPVTRSPNATLILTVLLPDLCKTKVALENPDVCLREVLERSLVKRGLPKAVRGLEYTLRKVSAPDIPLDLDMPVGQTKCRDFCIVRMNSKNPHVIVGSGQGSAPRTGSQH